VCLIGLYFYFTIYQMSKSTPLTQLPSMNSQQGFVNEQQRQMVMQAQSAVNAIPMPQNTQVQMDGNNEDDMTIQEVLNQIHATNGNSNEENIMNSMMGNAENPTPQSKQPMMTPQIMLPQITQQMLPNPMVQAPPQPQYDRYQQMQFMGAQPPQPQPIIDPLLNDNDGSFMNFIGTIAEDVKFAAFIFVLFIIVHFVPIDKFLMKYFALDKIPYYDIILKALLAFVVVILCRKLMVKF
jgi:hypothetical protein